MRPLPGRGGRKLSQPMAEAGGRRRACALGRGAAGGRRGGWGRGAGKSAAEAAAAAAAAAAAKRPCCVVCGAGGGGGGSKAERGDGRETPHTHGTRWPERQQHLELSGAPSRPRGPPAGGKLCPGGP